MIVCDNCGKEIRERTPVSLVSLAGELRHYHADSPDRTAGDCAGMALAALTALSGNTRPPKVVT